MQTLSYQEPHCGCHGGEHNHPRVVFRVDCEEIVVHTDRLTVREILDLVGEDPADHYLVELKEPENIAIHDLDQVVPLHDCSAFVTVYTKETPVS